MSITLERGYEVGWKHKNPSDLIFCVYFIDTNMKELLFTYAAKLDDEKFWKKYFEDLKKYDNNKRLRRNTCIEQDKAEKSFEKTCNKTTE